MTECYRCNTELERPIEANANYVRGDDMVVEETRPQLVALKHTERTRKIRDKVKDRHDLNATQANRVLGRRDPSYLRAEGKNGVEFDHTDLSEDDFEAVGVDEPIHPENDPDVVRCLEKAVSVDVQKTGLVCDSCLKDSDEIIW